MADFSDLLSGVPDYLGFGRLDRASIRRVRGGLLIRYVRADETVYRVAIKVTGECRLIELYEGKIIRESGGKTLQAAFTQHFLAIQHLGIAIRRDARFAQLARHVVAQGNIYFHYPVESPVPTVYFPAGLLYALRLPIVERNRAAWEHFKAELHRETDPVYIVTEQRGLILRLMGDGELVREPILVGEVTVRLIDVEEATTRMGRQDGLILPGKEYRLMALDTASAAPGMVLTHPGYPGGECLTFCVLPVDEGDPQLPGAIAAFLSASRGQSLRRQPRGRDLA